MKYFTPILLMFSLALASCSGGTSRRIPDTVPEIKGSIASIKKVTSATNEDPLTVLQVESLGEATSVYPRAIVKTDRFTHIEDHDGEVMEPEQLREGQLVEAWFDGPVLESDPVQVHAMAIRVILDKSEE